MTYEATKRQIQLLYLGIFNLVRVFVVNHPL